MPITRSCPTRMQLLRQRWRAYSNVYRSVVYRTLTGAGFIRLIGVTAVVAIATHTDGGSLSGGAAVWRALKTKTRTLG